MIKYPTKQSTYQPRRVSTSNRGMTFETLIDESNAYYLEHAIAVIHKKPTPVQIVRVDYPKRQMAKITEAYYKTPSTTDYNGVYRGYYIDFDVKETLSETAFPIKNIHPHQIKHLEAVAEHGGIAFILIYFKRKNTMHLLPQTALKYYSDRAKKGRKSMTYQEIVDDGFLVKEGYRPSVDYLKAVDQLIKQHKATRK